ncbi:MAG: MFS transporter [Solirubrobacteraceae bacterium]
MKTSQAARRSVAVILFCQGAAAAAWTTRLPSIKDHLHLGPGALGLALVGTPVGFALAIGLAPAALRRCSSAVVARWSNAAAALMIILPALASNVASLAAFLVVLGLAFGTAEISVNVQAVRVERSYGRPLMSGLHAMWSIGVIGGSIAGAIAASGGVSPLDELLIAASLVAALAAIAGRGLLGEPQPAAGQDPRDAPRGRERLLEAPVVVVTGLIAFCSFLAEGSVSDWSSVYLHSSQHASLSVAALSVFAYSVGQTGARLAGNRIITRLGRTGTLWRTAIVAAFGMMIALVASAPWVALLGYCVLGVGVATVVPISFSIAGVAPGVAPAWALSRVTGFGYMGSFLGPAVIGLIASTTSLKMALVIPAVLLLMIVPLTMRLRHVNSREPLAATA